MAIDLLIAIRNNRNKLELSGKSLTGKYFRGENAQMKTPGRVLAMKGKYCTPHPTKKFAYLQKHRPDLAQLALATLDKIYREARYPPPTVTPPCGDVYVLRPSGKPKYSRVGT